MKLKAYLLTVILAVVTVACCLAYNRVQAQQQTYTCAKELARCGEGEDGCGAEPYQSSLPAVDPQQYGEMYVPQEDFNNKCGVMYCYPVLPFQCSCGKTRSIRVCTNAEKSGS
jgi:hypothetical protein